MIKKYLICPGYVKSKNDNQIHYIGSEKLISLYKVNKKDCVIKDNDFYIYPSNLIKLCPNYYGDYILSKEINNAM